MEGRLWCLGQVKEATDARGLENENVTGLRGLKCYKTLANPSPSRYNDKWGSLPPLR